MSTGIVTTSAMRPYSPPNTMSMTESAMTMSIDTTTNRRVVFARRSMSQSDRTAAAMTTMMRTSVMS